jgi:acrylyl-CoA reductase (NADPH)
MSRDSLVALMVDQVDGQSRASFQEMKREALPAGEVLIEVAYSSLNYKDGLAVTGRGKVIRTYPMVPGIDLAGTVLESTAPAYTAGDPVMVNGWGLGETHWGGYAHLARVQADWITPLPGGFSLQQAMALGTAGLTAMVSVAVLEEHGLTLGDGGEVVVTGASGGVGSLAVAILAQLGYQVAASTGRTEARDYFSRLGAYRVMDRRELSAPPGRPLASARWAGAIDVVGGSTLASLLAAMASGSSVAVCGLAGGNELHTTVFPFILRGVNLLGIDASRIPLDRRLELWARLEQDFPRDLLDSLTQVIPLAEVPAFSRRVLDGQIRGRVVVDVQG